MTSMALTACSVLVQAIEEISEQASREWSIEKALDKMHADWQELNLELAEWKATGTHILRGGPLDEAQTLLDDHIIKSRAMSASPFAKPFAADIVPWVTRLTRLNAILEQWLTCQVLCHPQTLASLAPLSLRPVPPPPRPPPVPLTRVLNTQSNCDSDYSQSCCSRAGHRGI